MARARGGARSSLTVPGLEQASLNKRERAETASDHVRRVTDLDAGAQEGTCAPMAMCDVVSHVVR